jgi:hypothetical protein
MAAGLAGSACLHIARLEKVSEKVYPPDIIDNHRLSCYFT